MPTNDSSDEPEMKIEIRSNDPDGSKVIEVLTETNIVDIVISDLRALYAQHEPAHLEVVADLRDPEGRGIAQGSAKFEALTKAVDMRSELFARGCDPHAIKATDDPREVTLAGEYLEHLAALRQERHAALTAS